MAEAADAQGLLNYHWVLEFTRSRTPHLHVTAWWSADACDDASCRSLLDWVQICMAHGIPRAVAGAGRSPMRRHTGGMTPVHSETRDAWCGALPAAGGIHAT